MKSETKERVTFVHTVHSKCAERLLGNTVQGTCFEG